MSNSTVDPDCSQAWRVRPSVVLLAIAAGVVLLIALIVTGVWVASHRRLAAELAKVRTAGEPLAAEDMEAFYLAPPAEQDTTQLWLSALAPLDTPNFKADAVGLPFVSEGASPIPPVEQPWAQLSAAEQFLAKYQASLDGMHQAARLGGRARFPTKFADGLAMLLPHVQRLRFASQLLELESAVNMHRERQEAAVESVLAMFAAARSLEQEPLLISQLVRMALDGKARDRLAWLLSVASLDDEQLARFDQELAASDYQTQLRRALLGERSFGIQLFADPAKLGPEANSVGIIPKFTLGLTRASDETLYLQIMAQAIAAAGNTGPARTQAIADTDAMVNQLASQTGAKLRFPITLLMLPAMTSVAHSVSRNEAHRDATRLALAIERFRSQRGSLPTTLDDLVPGYFDSLPLDPFSGKSLLYRNTDANEYVVYSVGSNGLDDGGSSEPENQPADVVMRVKLLKQQQP